MENDHESLLRDGRHYDAAHQSFTVDIPFYVQEAKALAGPVLEVACGTGRITIPVAKVVAEVVGLDLSSSMLARAREKAATEGVSVDWVQADCRDFHLGRTFKLVFIPFNSLLLLHERRSLEAFFACVKEHLRPGGRFIIDVFNPNVAALPRDPQGRRAAYRYPDPSGRGEIVVDEESWYDDAAQVKHVSLRFSIGEDNEIAIDTLDVRCLFPQELDALLHYNGFRVIEKYGGHIRRPFGPGAPQQILICERSLPIR